MMTMRKEKKNNHDQTGNCRNVRNTKTERQAPELGNDSKQISRRNSNRLNRSNVTDGHGVPFGNNNSHDSSE